MRRTRSGSSAAFAAVLLASMMLASPATAELAGSQGSEGTSRAEAAGSNEDRVGARKSADARSRSGRHHSEPARQSSSNASDSDAESSTSEEQTSSPTAAVQLERPNDFQAQADPDGDENGGIDQPGGQGGVDTNDQDGNNGSGNDSDCEDDNRGEGLPGPCEPAPATAGLADAPAVLGVEAFAGAVPSGVSGSVAAPKAAQVLGVERIAAPSTGILPQTGASDYLALLTLAGSGAVAAGAATLVIRRRLRHGG